MGQEQKAHKAATAKGQYGGREKCEKKNRKFGKIVM